MLSRYSVEAAGSSMPMKETKTQKPKVNIDMCTLRHIAIFPTELLFPNHHPRRKPVATSNLARAWRSSVLSLLYFSSLTATAGKKNLILSLTPRLCRVWHLTNDNIADMTGKMTYFSSSFRKCCCLLWPFWTSGGVGWLRAVAVRITAVLLQWWYEKEVPPVCKRSM